MCLCVPLLLLLLCLLRPHLQSRLGPGETAAEPPQAGMRPAAGGLTTTTTTSGTNSGRLLLPPLPAAIVRAGATGDPLTRFLENWFGARVTAAKPSRGPGVEFPLGVGDRHPRS